MPRYQTSIATRSLGQSLRDAIVEAGSLGAMGVQFDVRREVSPSEFTGTARRDLLHLLGELGLRVAGGVFPLRHALCDAQELDRRVASLKEAMSFCGQLGATTFCVAPGHVPAADDAAGTATVGGILNELAAHANHVGVVVCLTPVRESAEDLVRLVELATAGPVAVDFDPAHFAIRGDSASDALRTIHPHVGHLQMRDGRRGSGGTGQETAVGRGDVSWAELLALLEEMEYSGWMTAIRNDSQDGPADVARAITLVQRALTGHQVS